MGHDMPDLMDSTKAKILDEIKEVDARIVVLDTIHASIDGDAFQDVAEALDEARDGLRATRDALSQAARLL